MYNTKRFRDDLRGLINSILITNNVTGYPVYHLIAKKSETKFIIFSLSDYGTIDERHSINLEMDVVGPVSGSDSAEAVTDAIVAGLDGAFNLTEETGFYVYPSLRNVLIDSSDPHTVRHHLTFDLYLYER